MNNISNKRIPVYGSIINDNPLVSLSDGIVSIPGTFKGQNSCIKLNESILSKHTMLIGGTGCGKSNVFYHIVSQLKKQMTNEDVMIIFDTKGDYYDRFFDKSHDCVLGNSKEFRSQSEHWNIFREILCDGWDHQLIEQNIRELSWSVFKEAIERSKDPFFPNAARELFASIIECIMKTGENDDAYKRESFYNDELKRALDESDITAIKSLIEGFPELTSVLSYIGDGSSLQALGVYAEFQSSIRKILTGTFAERGSFSIRNFVREKKSRTLFIEYDMSIGDTLSPIYSLIIDLAIKEALGRSAPEGNVYLICDEFKLLPYLQHIEDGVNFGRSLGLKIFAGLQSINQLTEAYGEYRGKNILAGFSSVYAFRANDTFTREFIISLHGKNYIQEEYKTINNTIKEEKRESNVVEDWDMTNLSVGEAVIGLPFYPPFRFRFSMYG